MIEASLRPVRLFHELDFSNAFDPIAVQMPNRLDAGPHYFSVFGRKYFWAYGNGLKQKRVQEVTGLVLPSPVVPFTVDLCTQEYSRLILFQEGVDFLVDGNICWLALEDYMPPVIKVCGAVDSWEARFRRKQMKEM